MKFIADLHVHSKFSRATAKDLDLEHLYIAAQLKGITVVGTGDFTHPGWFAEIREKLVPAEEGLFKLNAGLTEKYDKNVPDSCRRSVRFMLTSEISNIYKKNGKTRKNHNLVFMPDFEAVSNFNSRLDKICNIQSDGRPILGMDAKNLLDIALETSDRSFFVPAHIWTPWFSVLGSKSGFDSIEECFEDLTPYIFAVETGLSSDPPMNWRIKHLDGLTLISNSDAHSPMKLGREANIFDTSLNYGSIISAMKTGNPQRFLGTFEFYPEEGKYHLDGHRKCNLSFSPKQTMAAGGICPVCKKPLTLGVLYRVEELADRSEGEITEKRNPFYSIVPLADILSEILQVGPNSKKVGRNYLSALTSLGDEFTILDQLDYDLIENAGIPLLGEAIRRMRCGKLHVLPGYDGEYGKVKIFGEQERETLMGQKLLFHLPSSVSKIKEKINHRPTKPESCLKLSCKNKENQDGIFKAQPFQTDHAASRRDSKGFKVLLDDLNDQQRQAVLHNEGPMLIAAGPGTGKTRTLTHRIAYLVKEKQVLAGNILALTFTNKAAREMKERLSSLLDHRIDLPLATTFHSFCYDLLNRRKSHPPMFIIDENDRIYMIHEALRQAKRKNISIFEKPDILLERIMTAKQQILSPDDYLQAVANSIKAESFVSIYRLYQNLLSFQHFYDYEDLVFQVVVRLETDEDFRKKYQSRFKYIFVDEYQDLNQGQYRIIRALAPPGKNICVIGDPDQSIYGFRGSDLIYFNRFLSDYPNSEVINLARNYRSTETILNASTQVIKKQGGRRSDFRTYSEIYGIKSLSIIESGSEKAEAVAIGKQIEQMVGGMGFHSVDFGKVDGNEPTVSRSFSDFAVLYRTARQGKVIAEVFGKAGIPYQEASRESIFNNQYAAKMISFLKIIGGCGSYADFEKSISLLGLGIGKKSLEVFKSWAFDNNFTLEQALNHVRQFPLQGIKIELQLKFDTFIRKIDEMRKNMFKLTLEEKLKHIAAHTSISTKINEDKDVKRSFEMIKKISRNFGQGVDINRFFTSAALETKTDTDLYDSGVEKVALMTLHASKGLEFPVVFIAGCEKDFIPYRRPQAANINMDEERRLFYVAMTRAKEKLYLTYTKNRRIYGKRVAREVSPFVQDIEDCLKQYEATEHIKKKSQTQLKLF